MQIALIWFHFHQRSNLQLASIGTVNVSVPTGQQAIAWISYGQAGLLMHMYVIRPRWVDTGWDASGITALSYVYMKNRCPLFGSRFTSSAQLQHKSFIAHIALMVILASSYIGFTTKMSFNAAWLTIARG